MSRSLTEIQGIGTVVCRRAAIVIDTITPMLQRKRGERITPVVISPPAPRRPRPRPLLLSLSIIIIAEEDEQGGLVVSGIAIQLTLVSPHLLSVVTGGYLVWDSATAAITSLRGDCAKSCSVESCRTKFPERTEKRVNYKSIKFRVDVFGASARSHCLGECSIKRYIARLRKPAPSKKIL